MIKFTISADMSEVSVQEAIYQICAQYGSAGAMHDTFTIVCGEENASAAQRLIDGKPLRYYRSRHIVLPPDMLPLGRWAVVRDGNHGVWSEGCI